MAFDPIQEDCLRLVLESMRTGRLSPTEGGPFLQRAADAFRDDPAKLIGSDVDRSFHLTARAAELTDYRVPFLTDETEATRQEDVALGYLREAVELDEHNWDARRMLAELDAESNDAFLDYLLEHREEVARRTAETVEQASDVYEREFAHDLAHRPYLRWLAAIASRALISGRYRMALSAAEDSLAYAPNDPADIRHTAVMAMAKLEFGVEDLKRFRRRHAAAYRPEWASRRRILLAEKRTDPWLLIAQMSAEWRAFDYPAASRTLRALVRSSAHAAQALYYQPEFPEGLFSRVDVEPGGDDELILAISEATPLLQEGLGSPDAAGFAAWIAENELVRSSLDEQDLRAAHRVGGFGDMGAAGSRGARSGSES